MAPVAELFSIESWLTNRMAQKNSTLIPIQPLDESPPVSPYTSRRLQTCISSK